MAELSGLGYLPGDSFLHRMDVRVKMAGLMVTGVTALGATPVVLGMLTAVLAVAAVRIRLPLSTLSVEMRYALVLLLLVFAARALSVPGVEIWRFSLFSVSAEGVRQGGLVCWRLLNVMAAGVLFVVTASPSHIKAAVEWFLHPVPGVPEHRVSTMISLLIRFIPFIFHRLRETRAAQQARCAELRRNPVTRLAGLAFSTIRSTFETADHLVVAMEARCYSDRRTPKPLNATRSDRMALALMAGFAVLALCL